MYGQDSIYQLCERDFNYHLLTRISIYQFCGTVQFISEEIPLPVKRQNFNLLDRISNCYERIGFQIAMKATEVFNLLEAIRFQFTVGFEVTGF